MHNKEWYVRTYVEVSPRKDCGQRKKEKNRLSIRCNTLALENSKEMVIFICLFVYVLTRAPIHEVAHGHAFKYGDLLKDAMA